MKFICTTILSVIFILGLLVPVCAEDDFTVGKIIFAARTWGIHPMNIPVSNHTDETARVDISISEKMPNHFLTGGEAMWIDTSIFLEPRSSETIAIPVETPASFGRCKMEVLIYPSLLLDSGETEKMDTARQVFNLNFFARDRAKEYSDIKYALGPLPAVAEYDQLNFEFPRMLLYLTGTGVGLTEIGKIFELNAPYVDTIYRRLQKAGFFPDSGDTLSPLLFITDETTGMKLMMELAPLADRIQEWLTKDGSKQLLKTLQSSDIDSVTAAHRIIPDLLWMYALLPGDSLSTVPHYKKLKTDSAALGGVYWLFQGGDYFLPRYQIGSLIDGDDLVLGIFTVNQSIGYERGSAVMFRRNARQVTSPRLKASQLSYAVKNLRDNDKVESFRADLKKELDRIFDEVLDPAQAHHKAYFYDWAMRMIVSKTFENDQPTGALNAIRVSY